jgi:NAD(P)-dependent dehydrogenase (short-subunit alcohol dehydrogenase family)
VKKIALALLALVAAGATALVWRRRSGRLREPAVQLGLGDGAVHTLDRTDPSTAELEALAAGVRGTLTGGA